MHIFSYIFFVRPFYQFVNGLFLCARFLNYRCKHSNSHPEMIQYFNMINRVRKKTEYVIAKKEIKNWTYNMKNGKSWYTVVAKRFRPRFWCFLYFCCFLYYVI